MKKEKTYKIRAYCSNCGAGCAAGGGVSFEIPKGQWVERFLSQKVCGNCDCRGYLKRK